ncbi:hypothetical protein GCM10010307_70730 [Streptomyces vastus]|uniref:Uncharacterized protein n=1 Tax=Streptomyces vastus TaxID=285451 RepID=A0ABP6DZV5_9ACTN
MQYDAWQVVRDGMHVYGGDVLAHVLAIDHDGVRAAVEAQLEAVRCRHRRSLDLGTRLGLHGLPRETGCPNAGCAPAAW